jgi:hypothetical protein
VAPVAALVEQAGAEEKAIPSRWQHDAIPTWRRVPGQAVCEVRFGVLDLSVARPRTLGRISRRRVSLTFCAAAVRQLRLLRSASAFSARFAMTFAVAAALVVLALGAAQRAYGKS